jgi:glycosyltransferase involved in cell wall biosynthesis
MMLKRPTVSVCVPTYNYGRFLPETIESILTQSFSDFELLIVDDCSGDDTADVLAAYAPRDSRIIARVNDRNLGLVPNWNACLRAARGTYVKFVFGDDFLCSRDALRLMVERLDDPSVSLVASARRMVDEESRVVSSLATFSTDSVISGPEVINRCLREDHNLIGEPTAVMFRRDQAVRRFDPRYRQIVDMEMWFHLLEHGRFAYITEPLVSFRLHGGQQTSRNLETMVFLDDYMLLFDEYLAKPYIEFSPAEKRRLVFTMFHKRFKLSRKNRVQRELVMEKIRTLYGTGRFYRELARYKVRTLPDKVLKALTAPFGGNGAKR